MELLGPALLLFMWNLYILKWLAISSYEILINESPRYTGGNFMFLYQFVHCRRHPGIPGVTLYFCTGLYAAAAVAATAGRSTRDNFWTTFQISFIFGMIDGPDL